jgi:hypothetical protein
MMKTTCQFNLLAFPKKDRAYEPGTLVKTVGI